MSDSVYLGLKARQLEDSPEYQPINCVRLTIGGKGADGNPIVCEAGNPKSGRIIETSNPLIWDEAIGNAVAQNILTVIQGYKYKPYQADGAIINPAVEIGDAVEVGDVYSVIADIETNFSPLMSANISAPQGSDIDHEYPYESSESYAQNRTAAELGQLKTEFIVQNGEVSWAISQIGAADQEGSIWNKLTSVQTTVDGIKVRTEEDVQTIIGATEIKWAKVDVTPEQIKTEVEEYFDASGAANTAYKDAKREAKEYTDDEIDAIESAYKSEINQSAKEIKATVAASETIWNVYSLSPTEQNKFAVYGYGSPSNENSEDNPTRPSAYNGKYYLDQSTGQYWRSNGRKWAPQGTITEKLAVSQQSAITQNADSINSIVETTIPGIQRQVSQISQKADSISLTVSSDEYGQSTFTLSNKDAVLDTETVYLNVDAAHITGTIYANAVQAGASIYSPNISGGTIYGSEIYGARFLSNTRTGYLSLASSSYSDGTLYFGPYNSFQSRNNCFLCVYAMGGYTTLDLGGTSMIMTRNGSSRFTPGGIWDFSNCTQVLMPGGSHFP